jgi:hypothetical protein
MSNGPSKIVLISRKYAMRIFAYFATDVRKKREAESGVYLTPR